MRYTIWCNGQLVGETDLGFIYREGNSRTGHFFPTTFGETLVPIINEPRRLTKALGQVPRSNERHVTSDPEWIALQSALDAAYERKRSLVFELRDEQGTVIPTEDITIRDMELTLELYPGDDAALDDVKITPEEQGEFDRQIVEMREWAVEAAHELELLGHRDVVDQDAPFPRFQVMISLTHDWSIP